MTPQVMTETIITLGTFTYCAPELLRGAAADGRADQYALAATAYYLLTGANLFPHGSPVAVINAHLTLAAPPLSGLGPIWPVPIRFSRVRWPKIPPIGSTVAVISLLVGPALGARTGRTHFAAYRTKPGSAWEQTMSATAATRPLVQSRRRRASTMPPAPAGYPAPPCHRRPWGAPPRSMRAPRPRAAANALCGGAFSLAVLAVVAGLGIFAASKS